MQFEMIYKVGDRVSFQKKGIKLTFTGEIMRVGKKYTVLVDKIDGVLLERTVLKLVSQKNIHLVTLEDVPSGKDVSNE